MNQFICNEIVEFIVGIPKAIMSIIMRNAVVAGTEQHCFICYIL